MKWHTLEGGMRRMLIRILAATVAATLVTYLAVGVTFIVLEDRYIRPANYSERKVADVEALVSDKGAALLSVDAAPLLDDAVGDSDLRYQVVDADGRTLYGTYVPDGVTLDRQMLLSEINEAHGESEQYVHTVPVFNENSTFVGAIRCAYDFELRFTRTEAVARLASVFFVLALASPLLYLAFFSWRTSRRFAAQIREPLALLDGAAKKIKAQDLDFSIDYQVDNELGALCTAFNEMKDSLAQSLTRQWQLEEGRREMVAALAHDLKTPLSVIKAYSETLVDDTPLDETQHAYLDVIAENVDRSTALIQRIQDVSLLESAETVPNLAPLDLRAFLRSRADAHAAKGRMQGITVHCALSDALASTYLLDRERLTRIFDNLLGNSLQAVGAGGHVTLAAWPEDSRLLFEVRDDGPGFSARDLRHATEQFYRGDDARSALGGHAGLGLFIVQTLTLQLGGRVQLSNNAEGGACVRVCLPLVSAAGKAYNGEKP